MKTGKLIFKRILQIIPLYIGITFLTFLLVYITPGDAAEKKLSSQGVALSQEILDATREKMGLNRPFIVQYGDWFFSVFRGDLGYSLKDGRPVTDKMIAPFGRTVILASLTMAVSLVLSFAAAFFSVLHRSGFFDRVMRVISFIFNSLPGFVISVLLMYFLCIKVNAFPVISNGSAKGMVLPVLSLALPLSGRFFRQFRSEMLEEISKPYVAEMKMRGLKDITIMTGSILRGAAAPVITIVGLAFGTLLGGSVVIETIFSYPGIGKLAMDAISDRDYAVVQGFVLICATVYSLVNLCTDIAYSVLDPRVKTDERDY
ncbi:MAG: ABC transporter permease [Lachnospiraceae bacterium]|nr:ABC transporter permease [Lachnospiraceae bacterium]